MPGGLKFLGHIINMCSIREKKGALKTHVMDVSVEVKTSIKRYERKQLRVDDKNC
jgi:hypothetical protein